MAKSFVEEWVGDSLEDRREMAREEFILDATEAIWEALVKKGWTKAQLAEALDKSKAHVTQLLNGSRNMTLRTLSDIAFSLDLKAQIRLCERDEASAWEDAEVVLIRRVPKTLGAPFDAANTDWTEPLLVAQ